jgi:hypothetical protein
VLGSWGQPGASEDSHLGLRRVWGGEGSHWMELRGVEHLQGKRRKCPEPKPDLWPETALSESWGPGELKGCLESQGKTRF